MRITIPSEHWRERKRFLPGERGGWDQPPNPAHADDWLSSTRAWGDAWLWSGESLIAEVPSVIVPEESNLLLNPRHPAHREVVAEIVRPWVYDSRLLPRARAGTPQAGPPWQEPLGAGVVLEMVPIPAGEFLMGSPELEPGRQACEGPQHGVRVPAFSLAQTPITQAQWREVACWQPAAGDPPWERELDPDPSFFQRGRPEDDRRPVERVSWFDAQEFCRRLSRRTGRTYALPSEAQWEYACRAGTTTPYAFGSVLSERQANVSRSETTEVGLFPANAWGLRDMHGNVWEWCADHWRNNYVGALRDGRPWLDPKAGMDCQGCCAAALGTTIPGTAARPTAAGSTRTSASAFAVSASVASPRTSFFTLKLSISLHFSASFGSWLEADGGFGDLVGGCCRWRRRCQRSATYFPASLLVKAWIGVML